MKYVYTGPLSGVTLQATDGPKEIMLHPGGEVDLPADNEYVKTLVARKHLRIPVTTTADSKNTKPAKEGA